MDKRGGIVAIAALAAIGVVLLGYEAVQALRGKVLGGLGTTVVLVGLAAVIAAGALTIGLLNRASPTNEPAATAAAEPVPDALVESEG